jgi:hypothetical protein
MSVGNCTHIWQLVEALHIDIQECLFIMKHITLGIVPVIIMPPSAGQ